MDRRRCIFIVAKCYLFVWFALACVGCSKSFFFFFFVFFLFSSMHALLQDRSHAYETAWCLPPNTTTLNSLHFFRLLCSACVSKWKIYIIWISVDAFIRLVDREHLQTFYNNLFSQFSNEFLCLICKSILLSNTFLANDKHFCTLLHEE